MESGASLRDAQSPRQTGAGAGDSLYAARSVGEDFGQRRVYPGLTVQTVERPALQVGASTRNGSRTPNDPRRGGRADLNSAPTAATPSAPLAIVADRLHGARSGKPR